MTTQTTEQPITKEQAEKLITDFVNATETSQFMRDYQTRFLLGARVSGLIQYIWGKALESIADDRKIAENMRDYWRCKADGGVEQ